MTTSIFLIHLTATLGMFGLIWFVQVAHYPLFARVGAAEFAEYEHGHTRLTTRVVAPGMFAEATTGTLLLWIRPANLPAAWVWIGLALLAVIWLSTAFLQVPLHRRLGQGFDSDAHRSLVRSNWVRTAAWTARAALVVVMVSRVF